MTIGIYRTEGCIHIIPDLVIIGMALVASATSKRIRHCGFIAGDTVGIP
jgi:hypothetical protein